MNTIGKCMVGCVAAGLFSAGIIQKARTEKEAILAQSATRVLESRRHVEQGDLRAAESLLFQVNEDLRSLERGFPLAYLKPRAIAIEREAEDIKVHLDKRTEAVDEVLKRVAGQLARRDFTQAKITLATLEPTLGTADPAVAEITRVVDRIAKRDYVGQQRSLDHALQTCPVEAGKN